VFGGTLNLAQLQLQLYICNVVMMMMMLVLVMMERVSRATVVKSSSVLYTGSLPPSSGLPLHVNELKDIEPQLSSLVLLYKIDIVSL